MAKLDPVYVRRALGLEPDAPDHELMTVLETVAGHAEQMRDQAQRDGGVHLSAPISEEEP